MLFKQFRFLLLPYSSLLLSPFLLEVFASVLGYTLCVRAQVTELSAHPQLADSYLCRPYMPACFLSACVCVYAYWQQHDSVCVCVGVLCG